jgi:hypothetical protein
VGSYLLPLTPKVSGSHPKLIYEVSFREGCKVLNFRSNVVIKNKTKEPLDVVFEVEDQSPTHIRSPIGITLPFDVRFIELGPGESQSVPLELASVAKLRFRPSLQYNWSVKEKESVPLSEDYHFTRFCSVKMKAD